jgi:SAM-dependent methyltransferase
MPSDEELRAHYQQAAYFDGAEEQGYLNYEDMKKALVPHFRRRLSRIESRLPRRGRLLDFGCAAGYFLELARDNGWEIAGVELAADMASQASQALGVPIAQSLAGLERSDFDAVTLWEVVEHLPRPVEMLADLRSRLRPGGLLMLSTPNTSHWQAVRAPDAWPSYRPPSHLLYFTRDTLADALRRAGFAGVEVRRVSPLPPMPGWLQRATAGLQHGLATGQAHPWRLALYAWRATRAAALAWQKAARPADDVYTTLEAVAIQPP